MVENINNQIGQGQFDSLTPLEIDQLIELDALLSESPDAPSGFKTLGELLRSDITQEWLIEGILGQSQLAAIAGAPKTCKTIMAQHIALSVSRGSLFCDRTSKQGSVLCYFLEGGEASIKDGFQKKGGTEEDSIFINTIGPQANEEYSQSLRNAISSMNEPPLLVIIDTFAKFTGLQNENNYAECVERLKKLEDITKEFGVTIVFIHHAPKNANEGSYGLLGSTAIYGALDNRLWLKKIDGQLYLNATHRNAEEMDFTQINIDHLAGTISLGGTRAEKRQMDLTDEILDLVSNYHDDSIPLAEIKSQIKASTQLIVNTISELVSHNKLVEIMSGGRGSPKSYSIPYSRHSLEENRTITLPSEQSYNRRTVD